MKCKGVRIGASTRSTLCRSRGAKMCIRAAAFVHSVKTASTRQVSAIYHRPITAINLSYPFISFALPRSPRWTPTTTHNTRRISVTDYGHHISMKSRRCSPGWANLALQLSLMTKLNRWKPASPANNRAKTQRTFRLSMASHRRSPSTARPGSRVGLPDYRTDLKRISADTLRR